jgi:hypothetical protein
MLPALALYGSLVMGNAWNSVGIEALSFAYMGVYLLLGVDDKFWHAINPHLTILFYLSAAAIFLYFEVPMVQIIEEGYAERYGDVNRYAYTIGSSLRPLLGAGLLLGIWGLVRRDTGTWKYAQAPAPFVYFAVEAGIFKFRSAAGFVLLGVLSFLLLRPLLERRIRVSRVVWVLLIVAAAGGYFVTTESGAILGQRTFEDTQNEKPFDSRIRELEAFVVDLKWEIVTGRGLGGSFDASDLFQSPGSERWTTMHFGIVVFALKGGLVMLAIFLSFVLPAFRRRAAWWYQNPCNLSAALLLPVYLIFILLNPFLLAPEGLMLNAPLMLILSRFGRRMELDAARKGFWVLATNPAGVWSYRSRQTAMRGAVGR